MPQEICKYVNSLISMLTLFHYKKCQSMSGMGVVWEWYGSGMGVVWEWYGNGMGVV